MSSNLLVRVPPALPLAVAAAARAEGTSKSEFTRRALAKALAERESAGTGQEARP